MRNTLQALWGKIPAWTKLLLAAFGLLGLGWWRVLLQPNDYLLGLGGDGIKNYYTSLYQIRYGKGLHFEGMWHPFGEHVLYTDNMPLLSWILGGIHHYIMPIEGQTIGIINTLVLLSIVVGIFFIYLILRHYKVAPSWAIILSLIIGFLAPQIDRLTGHYSLAFTHFFPVLWYLLIRLQNSPSPWAWMLGIFAYMLVMGFTHSYHLLIGGAFLVAYAGIQWLSHRSWKILKYSLSTLGAALLPVMFFMLFMQLTDPIPDRHNHPYGILHYTSHYLSIFLPPYEPMKTTLRELITYENTQSEGWAYVGLVATATGLWLLFHQLMTAAKGRYKRLLHWGLPQELAWALWAAVCVLLFSLGFPFVNFPEILEVLPSSFKQFRTLGRFSWVFYYVFTVVVAIHWGKIFRFMRIKGLGKLATVLLGMILSFWAFEAYVHTYRKAKEIQRRTFAQDFYGKKTGHPSYLKWLKEKELSPADFQAILPLPYYHVGNEEVNISRSQESVYESCKASYETGLPIATGHLSRSSIQQSYWLGQLLGSPLLPKPVLSHFNESPLLLIVSETPTDAYEKYLLQQATFIGNLEKDAQLYSLPITAFNPLQALAEQGIQWDSIQAELSTSNKSPMVLGDTLGQVLWEDFESTALAPHTQRQTGFHSKHAVSGTTKGKDWLLLDRPAPAAWKGEQLVISFWIKVDAERPSFATWFCEQIAANGEVIHQKAASARTSLDYADGWVRTSVELPLQPECENIRIRITNEHCIADQLLIQKKGSHVFIPAAHEEGVWVNNYFWSEDML